MSGALPLTAACRWGGWPGPIAHFGARVRVRVWGPCTDSTPCAPMSRRCALWGWQEGVPREVPSTVVRRVRDYVFILFWLPVPGAGSRGPLPACCGCGCAGVRTQHWPLGVRALQGVARRGAGEWSPWGGGALTVVRGFWCQALPPPQKSVLGAGSRAPLPMFSGRGWRGCGDSAQAPP